MYIGHIVPASFRRVRPHAAPMTRRIDTLTLGPPASPNAGREGPGAGVWHRLDEFDERALDVR